MRSAMKQLLPLAMLAVAGFCTSAWAQQAASGLGQSWPNAPDVSSSPNWHVYVFESDGIRYVQVNDLNGKVRGAFATAGGQFLRLPMGADAQRVATPQQPLESSKAASGETVYRDNAVQVQVAPQANGNVQLNALPQSALPQSTNSTSMCNKQDCSGNGIIQ